MKLKSTQLEGKKILIIHFRVGKTDGVSLEIDAWEKILKKQGAEVALCSGPINHGAEYVIEDLEQQLNPKVFKIDENAFGGLKDFQTEDKLIQEIKDCRKTVSEDFKNVVEDFKPNHIVISNIFSVGEGFPIPGALLKVLDQYKIPTLLIHHDYYWENKRYDIPSCDYVQEQLDQTYIPIRDYIDHLCINSIAQEELKKRKNLNVDILYDTFDYRQPTWKRKLDITRFLENNRVTTDNIILLQATRIVRRKNIEITIDVAAELSKNKYLKRLTEAEIYNADYFDPDENSIQVVLSGYVEKRHMGYLEKLTKYAKERNVDLIYLGEYIHKDYELFDIYPYADIITYPSEYEGFGNQLLEAFFARKPVMIYEYPVFQNDIKPLGFEHISLGYKKCFEENSGLKKIPHKKIENAAQTITDLLTNQKKYQNWVEKNFELAKDNFSLYNARDVLMKKLEN